MNRNQRAALANPNLEFGASTFLGIPVGPNQMLLKFADREEQQPYEQKILFFCPNDTDIPSTFAGNPYLELVVLPSNIANMTIIPGTFSSSPKLETVVGLEDLEVIPDEVFPACHFLKFSRLNATTIGGAAFAECTGLERVELPNVRDIRGQAFVGCLNATIVLNDNVEAIGTDAFAGIDNLIYHGSLEDAPWGATKWNGVPQN